MSSESYMHRYAKTTLGSWVRRKVSCKLPKHVLSEETIVISNKKRTDGPYFGVSYEYPICSDKNGNIIGMINTIDKNSNNIWADYLRSIGEIVTDNFVPTYKYLKKLNNSSLKILYIFDIVYIDNAQIQYIFEICYKSPMTDDKIKFIKEYVNNYQMKCYELSAEKILEQTFPPKKIIHIKQI